MLNYLKEKWKIESNVSFILILIAFAITGSSSVVVSNYLINAIQGYLPAQGWLLFLLKVLITTPVYMLLLIIIGSLLGQYTFFSFFLQKMLKSIGRLFGFK